MLNNDLKKQIFTIIKGELIYNVIILILSLILYFTKLVDIDIISSATGLVIGFMVSIGYVYHMASSLNRAVDFVDAKASQRYYTTQKLIRDLVVLIIFVIVCRFVNVTVAIFGLIALFGVKIGAYFSPLLGK